MAIQTITEFTDEQQQIRMYNTRMKKSNVKILDTEQKYAVCLISLNPAVTQPDDYAALKVALEAITGIAGVELLIDGQAPAAIPASKQLRLICEAHLRIDDAPEP